jgi:DNA-binding NarL/FixJ family response regulator
VRVILVDDVPEIRRVVGHALRRRGGFDIVGEAGNGGDAVRLAGTEKPDIVVLDLGLPDITDRDVLSGVRAQSPSTKIVVFSGSAAGSERDWISTRVERYVLKGPKVRVLVDVLETLGRERGVTAVLDLTRDLASVPTARRFVRTHLTSWELEEVTDPAQLVASELVTNAITHARSPCQLRLSLSSRTVRVEVRDDGRGTPEPRSPSESGEDGRGMLLVSALAAAWGVEVLPQGGKVVWAELPLAA